MPGWDPVELEGPEWLDGEKAREDPEAGQERGLRGGGKAKHGLGAERVEAMAKVKLGGSRARPRRAKVRPYTRSVTPLKSIARTVELDPAPWHVPDE